MNYEVIHVLVMIFFFLWELYHHIRERDDESAEEHFSESS